jgi:hypothetical protein
VPAAHHVFTERGHGDFAIDGDEPALTANRRALVDLPWTWLHQVHGADVVTVTGPGEHAGASADAAVTSVPGAALSVQVADCTPVVLLGEGAVGVAHAGWRGLLAGVVANAVGAVRTLAPGPVRALVGPCIHAECYEFGADDLAAIAARFGDVVRGETSSGRPALDLPAAVEAALVEAGVATVVHQGGCTACSPDRWWSHRARGDRARQAAVVWTDP